MGDCRSLVILVVDDDQPVRRFARICLQNAGFTILEASDGVEGLKEFALHIAQVQLLLTDLSMPGMNGIELATHIRTLRPNLPIVFVSGSFAQFDDIPKPSGCLSLNKPFQMGDLVRCVEKAFAMAGEQRAQAVGAERRIL